MRKLTVILGCVLAFCMALQIQSAAAQTSTTGTTAKPSAAKPPATGTAAHSVLTLNTHKEKTSYALGMNIGHTVKGQSIDLDQSAFIQGMKDVLAGGKTLLTDDEMAAALAVLQTEMNAKAGEKAKLVGEEIGRASCRERV